MKKAGICPKCGSRKIGHFAYVADETDATTGPGRRRCLWRQSRGFLQGEDRADVEAFVCTECGFFEEYVRDPHAVAWKNLKPFRWHVIPQAP